MAFFNFRFQPKNELEKGGRSAAPVQSDESEPEKKCPNCHRETLISELADHLFVCTCGYHFRLNSRQRLSYLVDKGSFKELFAEVDYSDPISFPGYQDKIESAKSLSKEKEGVVCGTARIGGEDCCIFAMEPYFMMGSMGTAVGEKVTSLFEYATEHKMSVVGFTVSGGARMQEGLFSLLQMAKTSGAVKRHSDAGLFYLTVLTDPTTGGVTASFAMEGDIILAEPSATVGFAGARVIEQTTKKALPKGFQTSEFLLKHGFIDAIVSRQKQKTVIRHFLKIHDRREKA